MGADAIIGSHAHVIQEEDSIEVEYDGKLKTVPVFMVWEIIVGEDVCLAREERPCITVLLLSLILHTIRKK